MEVIKRKSRQIKILLLEDSPTDAELINEHLLNEGLVFKILTVDTGQDYNKALSEFNPDIILADYHLPLFDGSFALALAREKYPEIPFIFITGEVGEDKAVETLHKGATDFILKNNMKRLVPAIDRAIKEKNLMRERRVLYNALKENEERYRSLVENLPVGIFRNTVTRPGRIMQANLALAKMLGSKSVEELMKIPLENFYVNPSDRMSLIDEIIKNGYVKGREIKFTTIQGGTIWCAVTASPHINNDGKIDWIEGILEDITERKKAEEELTASWKLLESLLDTVNNPVFYKDTRGVYLGCNKAFCAMIAGMPREDIIGRTIHDIPDAIPDDLAAKSDEVDRKLIKNPGVQIYEALIKCTDGVFRHYMFNKSTFQGPNGKIAGIVEVMLDITKRVEAEIELRSLNEEMDLILGSITSIIIGVSKKDTITHWNTYAEKILGISSLSAIGKKFYECSIDWDWNTIYQGIADSILQNSSVRLDDIKFSRSDGKTGILGVSINPLYREGNLRAGYMILGRDLTNQRNMEQQLLQARKLEAIGQLAAGVAHEINSPLQYVGDNLKFLFKSLKGILELNKKCDDLIVQISNNTDTHSAIESIREYKKEIDIDYIMDELPKAVEQSLEGVMRVSKIVQSMKAFAHPGTGVKSPSNINKSIENTATISRNEWKYDCDLEISLDPSLPQVPCYEAEFNQVVLNLIVNAVDAIKEAKEKGIIDRGLIRIHTATEDDMAVIRISDNGTGIPKDIQQRIFDPFFTTKEVGKGTGQGLAIAHSIIVEKHGGLIYFESDPGRGTTFIIKLPIELS